MSNHATYHLTFGQIEESLGKLCTIKLKNNEKGLIGYLYNIDPVTSTIILLQVENNSIENELPSKYKILVIMHHVVSEFKVNNEKNGIPRHLLDKIINQRIEDFKHDSEKMQQRKENLISAHVSPPYVISSIECDNEIILQRVKDMITQLSFN
ncbi:18374_t:CDS:2 [Funneliformis geosporum]|uniref:16312_t:CDS:1 n=1 Tax=Funneliformis geosporum TaxID=1117311 RepID=A0A9W4WSP0_9GLOM|nr:18374_t:CDS:2 [Funneliformis geosporum]CAI2175753.1 16312_t:CDS:2 [Funneliformis geosporum]